MKKKIISLCLSLGLVLGASTVAFAAETTKEVTGTGSVTEAIIDVEIPTEFEFQIDPFNIANNGKVVTSAITIENKSNVPVEIQMSKLKGTVAGSAKLVNAIEAESSTLDAFLWIGNVTPTFDKSSGDIISVKPGATYSEAKNSKQVVTTEESSETISMGSLLQATYEDGSYTATNAKGKMYLGVMGDVNTVADWSEADSIQVTATFTVVPKVVGTVK